MTNRNATSTRGTAASLLSVALAYLEQGLSVIPLPAGRKFPPLVEWKPYQSRRPTELEVRQWWTQWPTSGIAIVCGAVSGVVVLDLDTRRYSDALTGRWPPAGPLVYSWSGGRHFYLAAGPRPLHKHGDLFHGVDFQGEGSYVVAPPSHHRGRRYQWQRGAALGEIPLPEVPAYVHDAIRARETEGPPRRRRSRPLDIDYALALHGILPYLDRVRRRAHGWVARCPAHDDQQPSLSVDVGRDGQTVLLHCFKGCAFTDILHALQARRGPLPATSRHTPEAAP